ncbi:Isochorismatase-like protein [Mycena alexandri]|uniref:Isochorismatase-like protein n=1 Tax=Mycena alexandri TaxID=1745969 RepID=A0AAD6XEF1_9AGAR|nr:Isochorismatase-like protein [Mycena alexandri]
MSSFRSLLGIAPSTANTSDSILIIIDAQNEYASGALAMSEPVLASTRPVIARLLEKYRAAGGAIVHVVHIVPDGAPVFTPGTPLAEEFAELAPRDGEPVVGKCFPGSFAETNLQEVVDATGLRKLVLVGYMAHVCVSTTAREGHQLGYDVLVAEDAVGDRNIPGASGEEVGKMVMLELADIFATIVKSGDIN